MAEQQTIAAPLSEQEIQEAIVMIDACPDLQPYYTARGGVVVINGPFPREKAQAATAFIWRAKDRERRLIATIAAKDAEISKLRMEQALSSHHQGPTGASER